MWKVLSKKVPEIPSKTLKDGFSIPVYGLGTWNIGGSWEPGPESENSPAVWTIRDIVDTRGITHIDTAEIYGEGNTERLIGIALKGRDRSRFFLTSKVFEHHFTLEGVIEACRASLERLRTDYLDLYLLHRYGANIQELMKAMNELKRMGLIRNIGVSNFGVEHLKEAQHYSKYPIVYNQVHYNLEYREPERAGLLEYCQRNDVMLTAYRPLQRGDLSKGPSPVLEELCKKYKKTPAQVALNWLISQRNVVVIPKTRSLKHLDENLGSLGWEMDVEDIEKLRAEYPGQKYISNIPLG